jgi:hypothetical protein
MMKISFRNIKKASISRTLENLINCVYRMGKWIPLFCVFVIIGCKKRNNTNDITSDWYFDTCFYTNNSNLKMGILPFGKSCGFTFLNNKKLICHPGFYTSDSSNTFQDDEIKYEIVNDSLIYFDPIDNLRKSSHIKINNDSLWLIDNKVTKKFIRLNSKINKNYKLDKAVLSSTICYGSCVPLDISIDKLGNVLIGQDSGFIRILKYTSISEVDKYKIWNNFAKSDYINLKSHYTSNSSDDQITYLTFIRDNKIVKSIEDYGNASPIYLLWAYWHMENLIKKLNLQSNTIHTQFELPIYVTVKTQKEKIRLSKSESFFLQSEILKAKIISSCSFLLTYIIENNENIIWTDGRYFSFEQHGKRKYIDIGYNFLQQNFKK